MIRERAGGSRVAVLTAPQHRVGTKPSPRCATRSWWSAPASRAVRSRGPWPCTAGMHSRRAARRARRRGMGINLPGNATRALGELGAADHVVGARRAGAPAGVPQRRGAAAVLDRRRGFWRGVGPPLCVRRGHLLEALSLPSEGVVVRDRRGDLRRASPTAVSSWKSTTAPSTVRLRHRRRRRAFRNAGAVVPGEPRPSLMTGSSWRFIVDNPGIDCWTAWSGRTGTVLLIPVEQDLVYGYAARTRGGPTGADPAWLSRAFAGFPRPVVERSTGRGR